MGADLLMRTAAQHYHARGWAVIPVITQTKEPAIAKWSREILTEDELNRIFTAHPNRSIGIVLGDLSNGLIDVDLDDDVLATIADQFLPPTGFVFGRTGKLRSHYFYITDHGKTIKFQTPWNTSMMAELRSTGAQTVVPPSTYPNGGHYIAEADGDPSYVAFDQLKAAVALAVVSRTAIHYWPDPGQRNEFALALSGVLAKSGVPFDDAKALVRISASIAGDDEVSGRVATLEATYDKLQKGETISGWGAFQRALSDDTAHKAAAILRRTLEIGFPPAFQLSAALEYTDLRLAQYVIEESNNTVVYVPEWKQWLEHGQVVWEGDDDIPIRRAVNSLGEMYRKRIMTASTAAERAEYSAAVKRLEMTTSVSAIATAAKTIGTAIARPSDFDANPLLLATATGAVDLETGQKYDASPQDFFLRQTAVDPIPGEFPVFDRFMKQICSVHHDLEPFLWRAFAYTLTGLVSERSAYILSGAGLNGKSLLLKTLAHIFGTYAEAINVAILIGNDSDRPMPGIAKLRGARYAYTTESNTMSNLNTGLIKRITGGDAMSVRQLYEREQVFYPMFKLWLATNENPNVSASDDAMWDRLKLIPMEHRFPRSPVEASANNVPWMRDYEFIDQVMGELPAILHRLISTVPDVLAHGVGTPPSVREATQQYRDDVDTAAMFVAEELVVTRNENDSLSTSDTYAAYANWCASIRQEPLNNVHFGRRMSAIGIPLQKRKGVRSYIGITFNDGSIDTTNELTIDRVQQ